MRWLDQVEEDLKKMKVRNWREKCKDRRLWNEILKHVARMGQGRGVYRVLVGKPERKRPLGRPRRRWEDNINTMWTGDADLRLCITTVQDG